MLIVVGILASVVVITLIGQTGKASDSALKTNLRSLASITSDVISRDFNYNFEKFCDIADTSERAAYGVKGIMNSVFETAGFRTENAISRIITNSNGNVSLYFIAVKTSGDSVGNQARSNDLVNTRIEYGCASHNTGWVAWGALQEDIDDNISEGPDYYCVDSFGSNGSTELSSVPTNPNNIKITENNIRLTCALIEDAD